MAGLDVSEKIFSIIGSVSAIIALLLALRQKLSRGSRGRKRPPPERVDTGLGVLSALLEGFFLVLAFLWLAWWAWRSASRLKAPGDEETLTFDVAAHWVPVGAAWVVLAVCVCLYWDGAWRKWFTLLVKGAFALSGSAVWLMALVMAADAASTAMIWHGSNAPDWLQNWSKAIVLVVALIAVARYLIARAASAQPRR